MGNYEELKAAVASVIKTNGNQEITGQVLQNTLTTLISQVGANATFAGIATPETAPGTPDQNVFYIAGQSGVYANFGGYKVTKNAVAFNNVGGNWVATELNLLSSGFGDSAVYDMAYSGYLPVDLGHLYSYESGTGHYVAHSEWDAVTLRIYNPTGKLEITGANVAYFVFFDEPRIKDTYLKSNTTGIIPAGAKLCVMDMRKADNPDGYANLRVRQYASGADRNEVSVLNQSALEVFSDTYNMAVKFDDQDITPEPIIGQWFNSNIPAMVVNENYKCYKLDVSGYVGKVLHGYTYTSGTMWSCAMTDENNVVLAKFNYRTTGDGQSAIVDRMFYIGSGVKYLYINCSVTYMGAFIKTTKRELNTNKVDISPVNMKMRDVATYIGEPFVIPNHYGELSGGASDNGNIKPSANFDLVVIKLLSRKPIIVEGATCKFYLFYNSGDLKNETYLGNNRTGDYIAGAQYAALLFEKSTGSKGLNYNQIRIIQDGTVIKHDDVLRQHNIETLTPDKVVHGYFIMPDGSTRANASFRYERYNLPNVFYDTLLFSAKYGSRTNIAVIFYFDKDDNLISEEYRFDSSTTGGMVFNNAPLHIPDNTAYILFNINEYYDGIMYMKTKGEYYDLGQMETDIENIKGGKKLIKLHVYDTEPGRNENAFYVRAKYNDTKDILLLYYINLNTLLSPKTAYIGANTLSDADLMASANIVSNHSDSTAPLFQSSLYWHLYAQHGYVIPVVPNTVGLTTADIGALWKDQLDRQYNIGNVVGSSIYLLPVITRGTEGNDTRGWKTPNNPVITALTHVSGGTVTTPITVASQSTTQLRPIMKHENRKFYIDGRELTEPGDYEGDDFTVSESQTGYDPASIETWFPTPGVIGTPDLTGAVEMARFTWSYNFRGAQCCVNTTIDIRRKVECQSYGATQQQTFVDTGNYKAMFMIPKAADASNGTVLEKPFNSPSLGSTGYSFFRNATYLKDVDKPIDRLIAMLHNPNDNTYLVGMAAGLSLVSGETIPAKRNANIPIAPNANDAHYRLGSFSPSNNNKFYIAAINTSPFADDGYNLPNTYFKEINYYISYFDPAANPGQLYWYKDGNSYIIYSHCQSVQSRVALTLPDFMEGLNVEIVEQTDNAVLLTDTVQNGKLFVSYNTDDANYLVLRTK
jgi:hypothetical protein